MTDTAQEGRWEERHPMFLNCGDDEFDLKEPADRRALVRRLNSDHERAALAEEMRAALHAAIVDAPYNLSKPWHFMAKDALARYDATTPSGGEG